MFTRVGDQIALDVGYFDFREAYEFANPEEDTEPGHPHLYISNTFVLNSMGALELYACAESLLQDLEANGLVDKKEVPQTQKEDCDAEID
jgi:hypothetical protein